MTQRELQKLKRQELLELLLTQGEEAERNALELDETKAELAELQAGYERLKKRLDLKDAEIRRLCDTLDKERKERRITLDEAGSIAEASLRLNGIFEAAQRAADQYLFNIRQIQGRGLPEDFDGQAGAEGEGGEIVEQ